jgi:hypothetical protein
MGDFEGPPSTSWSWDPGIWQLALENELQTVNGRLISIHRRDGGVIEPYTAVWVTNSGADEHDWDWSADASPTELDLTVRAAGGRLICIDSFSVDEFLGSDDPHFAGVWVANTGSFFREWDWDWDLTPLELAHRLGKSGRLISLTTYEREGGRLYAAVWVKNTGVGKRKWDWDPAISFEDLRQKLSDFPGRLVSMDPFMDGSKLRFAAVWVDAGDQFAKLWWWGVGTDAATVSMDSELFCSYLVEARTLPYAPSAFAHFRYGFPRSDFEEGAQLVNISGSGELVTSGDDEGGFSQLSSATLQLKNGPGKVVQVTDADVLLTYDGWYWPDWANKPLFESGGAFEGEPTEMQPSALYAGSMQDWWGELTHFIPRVRAEAGGGVAQRTALALPILRPGYQAPAVFTPQVPVYLGLWSNPLEIVPLWYGNKQVPWMIVGGMIVNWSGKPLRIGGLHITVKTPGGHIVVDRELNYDFRAADGSVLPAEDSAHAYVPGEIAKFLDGVRLPAHVDLSAGLSVQIVLAYKLPDGWCGAAARLVEAQYLQPITVSPPVAGRWKWGNGPPHLGFDVHSNPAERYCYDFGRLRLDANGDLVQPPVTYDGPTNVNKSFLDYGQPVRAVADGSVVMCRFDVTQENHGWIQDGVNQDNFVLLAHDPPANVHRSGYYHLQPKQPRRKSPLEPGVPVSAGDIIGYVGNSGGVNTSEPHLHFGYSYIDKTGRKRPYPLSFNGMKTLAGTSVSGVPSTAEYIS